MPDDTYLIFPVSNGGDVILTGTTAPPDGYMQMLHDTLHRYGISTPYRTRKRHTSLGRALAEARRADYTVKKAFLQDAFQKSKFDIATATFGPFTQTLGQTMHNITNLQKQARDAEAGPLSYKA